jgi:AIPR protein
MNQPTTLIDIRYAKTSVEESAMSSPEQLVLDSLLTELQQTEYPDEDPDVVFEIYAASQILKPRNVSPDDIVAGMVDGSKDGGIDSFYVFVNSVLLSPDDPLLTPNSDAVKKLGAHPSLEVFLVQTKNSTSWSEGAWEHLLSSLTSLLDPNADEAELETYFNPAVVERTGIFRRAIKSLATKFPKTQFRLLCVSPAPEGNVKESIRMRAAQVEELVRSRLPGGADVNATHVGVATLYTLAGTDYAQPGLLTFRSLIREKNSYLGTVSVKDYLRFVRSEGGELRDELFDSNVRDYEGDNVVNEAIRATLATAEDSEFWWLNNGVTVLGTEVGGPQLDLVISQPLIVNGLQTTIVLDRAEKEGTLVASRLEDGIVVRVIESGDEDTRDKVIAGTNRQTQVPNIALYATQQLQRDIERFFAVHNWYYERRKNQYKNLGKPAKRRVTMNLLAQSMITLMLGEPDTARARPSTLLSRKEGYASVFPDDLPVDGYLAAVEVVKAVDEYLKTASAKAVLDEYTNTRFYVGAGYEVLALKITDPTDFHFRHNYKKLSLPLDEGYLEKALKALATVAQAYQAAHPKVSRDSIFKSADFRHQYFAVLTAANS